jgi:hypothetical protein
VKHAEGWKNSPAAKRLRLGCDTKVQNRSCSLLNVCIAVLLAKSQTLTVLSSPHDTINSCLGWKTALETLLKCPLHESSSHAFVSLILQILIVLSSAAEMIRGKVGWKVVSFVPRSRLSRKYLTVENVSDVSNAPAPEDPRWR